MAILHYGSYLRAAHDPAALRTIVVNVAAALLYLTGKQRVDAIAVRGVSGACVGYPVSITTGIPVVNVRKSGEFTHGATIESCGQDIRTYVILDDLVESGATVCEIRDAIAVRAKEQGAVIPTCLGLLLWRNSSGDLWDYEGNCPKTTLCGLPIVFPETQTAPNRR